MQFLLLIVMKQMYTYANLEWGTCNRKPPNPEAVREYIFSTEHYRGRIPPSDGGIQHHSGAPGAPLAPSFGHALRSPGMHSCALHRVKGSRSGVRAQGQEWRLAVDDSRNKTRAMRHVLLQHRTGLAPGLRQSPSRSCPDPAEVPCQMSSPVTQHHAARQKIELHGHSVCASAWQCTSQQTWTFRHGDHEHEGCEVVSEAQTKR